MTALVAPAAARADHVGVFLTSPFEPSSFARRGAVGLVVPGKGPTYTRAEMLELLEWGELGTPRCANRRPCSVEIFIPLPPPGEHHNVRRYPIAIVGERYRGLLASDSTRIPGLVAPSDVPATVRALERGEKPVIEARSEPDAPGRLARLDRRLTRAHDSRLPAMLVLIGLSVAYAGLAARLRSRVLAKAALLVAPVALVGALALSALGIDRRSVVIATLLATTAVGALAGGALLPSRGLAGVFVALLAVYLVVLAVWPEVNSLAVIGPHPDGGGRFYGVTNQMQTLFLLPTLLAAALLGRRWLPLVAVLALATVGTSRTGADGGGVLVLLAGLAVLAFRLYGVRMTPRRLALIPPATIALGLALVTLDAALRGSSHVTRAVGEGPAPLLGELGHRLAVSFAGATSSWHAGVIVVVSIAAIAWFATRRPRTGVMEALVVGLGVSLVVNDTPFDVAGFGALSCLALWSWQRSERQADRAGGRL